MILVRMTLHMYSRVSSVRTKGWKRATGVHLVLSLAYCHEPSCSDCCHDDKYVDDEVARHLEEVQTEGDDEAGGRAALSASPAPRSAPNFVVEAQQER